MKKLQSGMGQRTEKFLEEHKKPKASPWIKLFSGIFSIVASAVMLLVTLVYSFTPHLIQGILPGIWFISGALILIKYSSYKRTFNEELLLAKPFMNGETFERSSFLIGQKKIMRKKTANENFKTIIAILLAFYISGIAVWDSSNLNVGYFLLIFPLVGILIMVIFIPIIFQDMRVKQRSLLVLMNLSVFLVIPIFAYIIYAITASFEYTLLIGFGTVILIIIMMIVNKKRKPRRSFMNHIVKKVEDVSNETENG